MIKKLFFCFCLLICYCVTFAMEERFVICNNGKLQLKMDDGTYIIDCRPIHITLQHEATLARKELDTLGISQEWKRINNTFGNVAVAKIEFIFNNGTTRVFDVKASPLISFFSTIAISNEDYQPTYRPIDLKNGIFSIQKVIPFYTDTEVQVVNYLFCTTKYMQLLAKINPKEIQNIRYILLHIYTELDPCDKCRKLLDFVSKEMNKKSCDPGIFLRKKISTFNAISLKGKFGIIISSTECYGEARELRQLPNVFIDEEPCIFMPNFGEVKCHSILQKLPLLTTDSPNEVLHESSLNVEGKESSVTLEEDS